MEMTIDESIKIIEPIINNGASKPDCALEIAVDIMRKYQKLEEFARWVAGEVIDEDMWSLNYLAFAELACRKLVKLGIMQESNGEYLYEVIEDGND